MPDKRKKITPGEFANRLQAVLGNSYEKALSEGLGVSLTTPYRWCSGDVPIPEYAVAVLEFLEVLPKAFRPPRWNRE